MSQTPSIRTRLVHQLITFGALFQRPMTLGVRGLIIDKDERILLVKHTYVTGFYLPGGGVEPGETIVQALERELREECAISLKSPPLLHNIYLNKRSSSRDHVALFLIRDFSDEGPRLPDKEIAEVKYFSVNELPNEATPATRARINEIINNTPTSSYW
jgi:ADP-ribose pyrophosphatase YjhB (NUDIX family)